VRSRGRGVTIHRRDCANILRLKQEDSERLIEVEWGSRQADTYPVDIEVLAYDRAGLLHDVTAVLANEKINMTSVNTYTDPRDHLAHLRLTVEISDIDELSRILTRIGPLPNVLKVHRRL
jgi:GTP pyrophosphokinase